MIQNYMEVLVDNALNKELSLHPEKYDTLCRCPACMAQVRVSALNELAPFYVTCVTGEVYGEYRSKELQYQSDVLVAVGRGVEQVLQGSHSRALAAPAH
ncbi:late competence development ComFB family protein [Ruminococcaceae bacterium OttesenSCG-928-D13]|nr:late competence development ComFB family protein [Ruminococcaceae bacterium OttesenSCG-928-D13]